MIIAYRVVKFTFIINKFWLLADLTLFNLLQLVNFLIIIRNHNLIISYLLSNFHKFIYFFLLLFFHKILKNISLDYRIVLIISRNEIPLSNLIAHFIKIVVLLLVDLLIFIIHSNLLKSHQSKSYVDYAKYVETLI
jgi:hypothetical protein